MSGNDVAAVILIIFFAVGAYFLGYSTGRKDGEESDVSCGKCSHLFEAHASTMPCSLCDCKDYEQAAKGERIPEGKL